MAAMNRGCGGVAVSFAQSDLAGLTNSDADFSKLLTFQNRVVFYSNTRSWRPVSKPAASYEMQLF